MPDQPATAPTEPGRCLTHGACEHGMNYCVREICLPCEAILDEISARERGGECVYVDGGEPPEPTDTAPTGDEDRITTTAARCCHAEHTVSFTGARLGRDTGDGGKWEPCEPAIATPPPTMPCPFCDMTGRLMGSGERYVCDNRHYWRVLEDGVVM